MKLPNDVSPGSPVSAKEFNLLLRYIRSLKVMGGPGVWVTHTLGGTTVKLAPTDKKVQSVAGGETYKHPFKCVLSGTQLSVYPGFVNGQVPTIASVALDAETTPTLSVINGLNVVYLKTSGVINTETGVETIARSIIELGPSLPENTATEFAWSAYQTLTRFIYSEETPPAVIPQFIQVNLRCANFGRFSSYFA